jgi:hypothetical protein
MLGHGQRLDTRMLPIAAEAKAQADAKNDPADAERRWLTLVCSDGFTEKIPRRQILTNRDASLADAGRASHCA